VIPGNGLGRTPTLRARPERLDRGRGLPALRCTGPRPRPTCAVLESCGLRALPPCRPGAASPSGVEADRPHQNPQATRCQRTSWVASATRATACRRGTAPRGHPCLSGRHRLRSAGRTGRCCPERAHRPLLAHPARVGAASGSPPVRPRWRRHRRRRSPGRWRSGPGGRTGAARGGGLAPSAGALVCTRSPSTRMRRSWGDSWARGRDRGCPRAPTLLRSGRGALAASRRTRLCRCRTTRRTPVRSSGSARPCHAGSPAFAILHRDAGDYRGCSEESPLVPGL
jgi:hypothetical protein